MKTLTLSLALTFVLVPSIAVAETNTKQHVRASAGVAAPGQVVIELRDGTRLLGVPLRKTLALRTAATGSVNVAWTQIRQLRMADNRESAVAVFRNEDRLTGVLTDETIGFATLVGKVAIPTPAVVRITYHGPAAIGETVARNVALGKKVSGRDGAAHGKARAVHLTDGNFATFTKPPSSRCDYTIDLRQRSDGTACDHTFRIDKLVVHWGEFGTRFLGIPKGDGKWASGSWPGTYVTQYQIEYQTAADPSGEWKMLHRFDGQPADESSETVQVVVVPSKRQGAGGDVTTTITGIEVGKVIGLRIRTRGGGHWIGIYELEAYGCNDD